MNILSRSALVGFLLAGGLLAVESNTPLAQVTPFGIGELPAARNSQFEQGYFGAKEDGWFWYKDPVPEEEVPAEEPVEPEQSKIEPPEEDEHKETEDVPEEPEAFSVQWLRKNMPVLMDRAIDDPTDENVSAYLYAQRIALDKAQNYAEKTQHVIANDPFLDENNRVPLATFAKKEFLTRSQDGQTRALDYLGTQAGLWVFFDSTCDFCHIQTRIVQSLAKKHRFHTMFISMNGEGLPHLEQHWNNQGQAEALGVQMTPTTVLAVPPNTYLIVSQGMMAEDQLSERLVIAADSNNLFPEEYKEEINLYRKGVLSPEDLKDGASDDPAVWLKRLKEKISGK